MEASWLVVPAYARHTFFIEIPFLFACCGVLPIGFNSLIEFSRVKDFMENRHGLYWDQKIPNVSKEGG